MRDEQKSCLVGPRIELQDYFINYKRLKKLLRNLGAPGFTEIEVKEQERIFMTNLESEIARVEEFFAAKESQYFDSYSHKLCPRVFGSTSGIHAGDTADGDAAAAEDGQEDNKELIKALNCSADKLRYLERFASFNLMAVVKIVKKHDKHSSTPISAKVISSLSERRFVNSLLLPVVSQGVQALSAHVTRNARRIADITGAAGQLRSRLREYAAARDETLSSHSLFLPNATSSPVEQLERPSSSFEEGVAALTEANLAVHNSVLAAKAYPNLDTHDLLQEVEEASSSDFGEDENNDGGDDSNGTPARGRSSSTRSPNAKPLSVKPKIAKAGRRPPISRLAAVEKRIACVKVEAWRRSVANGCNTVKYEGKLETELGKLERARQELRACSRPLNDVDDMDTCQEDKAKGSNDDK